MKSMPARLGLHALGVAKGDRVGIWAPNCAEWVFVQYGTAKLGAILVNINPAYRTHELSYVLKQAGISVLVSAPEFKTADYRAMVAEIRDECPELREVIFLGDRQWEQLMASGRAGNRELLAERERELSADDPINIQYTSGTTGFPKGATLTHHNLLNNGFFVGEGCGYTEDDRVCIPVPYYHCFGMGMGNLGCTSHGATMIIPAPGFDPGLTLKAVQDERCTSYLTWAILVRTFGAGALVSAWRMLVGEGVGGGEGVVAGLDGDAAVAAQGLDELLDRPAGLAFEPAG